MDTFLGALVIIGIVAWYAYAAIAAWRKWLKEDWHKDDPSYAKKNRW